VANRDEAPKGIDRERAWLVAGAVLFTAVFLKNAWVDEDAYITFRTVEQLFAGNGLRWNPHERVQAFTHPLWLAGLSTLRIFIRDLFPAAILLSFLSCVAGALALGRLFRSWRRRCLLLILFLSSKSFFDFTTSGLENPLAYALLAVFLLLFLEEPEAGEGEGAQRARLLGLTTVLSLLILTRHDLVTLVGPAWGLAVWRARAEGWTRIGRSLGLGLSPLLAWTVFSLFYYGFALPNTAYAKLATGIPAPQLWWYGRGYLVSLAQDDPLTGAVILAGIAAVIAARRRPAAWALAAGLTLNVVYVMKVGGDYMSGRFLASAFLVASVSVCAHVPIPRRAWPIIAVVALAYAIVLPGAPIKTGRDYTAGKPNRFGVGDQRGIFFQISSLHRWLAREPGQVFPDYRWSHQGLAFAESEERVRIRANVGFMGYWAGTDRILIDRLALSDPLLARLPSVRIFRIGHYPRRIPPGYLESVETGDSLIEDAELRAFHERLRIVTEGPLLAPGRLKTIVRMNLGHYDHLLHAVPGKGLGKI
jgi:arabinofuranosyltransferase